MPATPAVDLAATVRPTPDEAAAAGRLYDAVPLRCRIGPNGLTGEEVMRRLCRSSEDTGSDEPGFLLEGAGPPGTGRWSTVGFRPRPLITGGDPLPQLQALCATSLAPAGELPTFRGGAVGYLGWECVRYVEPSVALAEGQGPALPESAFLLAEDLAVVDHETGETTLVTVHHPSRETYAAAVDRLHAVHGRLCRPAATAAAPTGGRRDEWRSNTTPHEFEALVRRAQEHIAAGDVFQVVLSQRFTRKLSCSPLRLYHELRAIDPSRHPFLLCLGEGRYVIGASPELLVRNEGRRVVTRPLAGTRPRGTDRATDASLELELRADRKERAEHVMLVDLGRNDIGRVAAPGTVTVDRFADVERFSHVMHLSSTVSGTLDEGRSAVDALRSTFPAGTVSGAPKVRAMQLIAELEGGRRGVYGGALGTVGYGGVVEMAIVLRTFVAAGGLLHVQSGAGIVVASEPEAEYAETLHKAAGLFAAADRAEADR